MGWVSKVQSNALLLIVALSLTLAVVYGVKPIGNERNRTDFSMIPKEIDGWTSVDQKFDEETIKGLPQSDLLLRTYSNELGEQVTLAIVYGTDLGDFHQPEICMQGQGWRITDRSEISLPVQPRGTIQAISLIMEHDTAPRSACLYWFSSKGRTATFLGSHKLRLYLYRLVRRKIEPAALIRFTAPVEESDEHTQQLVCTLAGKLFPYLQAELNASDGNIANSNLTKRNP